MAKQFLTPTGLLSLNTDPVGTLGAIYYNIVEDAIKVYNGTTWNAVGSSSSQVEGGSASSNYMDFYDGGNASGS
jgi:hypothetical protein